MRFEHAPAADYSDLASGHVLFSAPGHPAFPVRLTLELFERARLLTGRARVGVWDPMCGAGSIVTTLGLARADAVSRVLASDVSVEAVGLAAKNLGLLGEAGLLARAASGGARAVSARRLLDHRGFGPPIPALAAVADITRSADLDRLPLDGIHVVIADLPYGSQTHWRSDAANPAGNLVRVLRDRLHDDAVIVLCSTQREHFREVPPAHRSFRHGRRIIKFYGPPWNQS